MTRPTRVALVADELHIAGGVERFVCGLANHLVHAGFDVAVATVDTARERIAYALDPTVRVLTGAPFEPALAEGGGRLRRYGRMLRAQWRLGRALSRALRADAPDVVVLNGLTTACSLMAVDASLTSQTICCDHNHFGARSGLWGWLRRRCYPRVAALVSLTQADAPKFAAINPRTEVIHNASALRSERPLARPDGVVLAVGRHVAQKGFDLLLDAWGVAAAGLPHARLRIVGSGALTAELQAFSRAIGVDRSVEWAEPTRDIARHFAEASLFVLPSRYEGMPLALLEAQALGLPCIAFDCPTGPAEIIDDASGIVVPALDVTALSAALIALMDDPPRRAAMAEAAWRRSAAHFGMAEHLDRWTALIRRVADERHAS